MVRGWDVLIRGSEGGPIFQVVMIMRWIEALVVFALSLDTRHSSLGGFERWLSLPCTVIILEN